MIIEFPPDISKDFILSKLSEEEIFEAYGVPLTPFMFRSTLRVDKRPTCKFYRRSNGKLILRDYTGHFWGDCFDLVTLRTGKKFYEALEDIAKRFKLIPNDSGVIILDKLPERPKVVITENECEIRIKRLEWTPQHLKFWEQIGVSRSTLEKFNIFPLDRAWLNGSPVFWYGYKKEIAFAYHFKEYGPFEYKLYFPFRDERRFLHSNASVVQGYGQLPEKGEVLVVTKSYKDVAALYEFALPACAPMAETQIITENIAKELSLRFEKIFTLYDVDRLAGVRSMKQMRKLYGWTPLFFNVRKNHPKDFTDFILKYGVSDTKLLIDDLKAIYL